MCNVSKVSRLSPLQAHRICSLHVFVLSQERLAALPPVQKTMSCDRPCVFVHIIH